MSQPEKSRNLNVKTPGAPSAPVKPTAEDFEQMAAENAALEKELLGENSVAGGDTETDPAPQVAPDIQALIDAAVDKRVAQQLAAVKRAQAPVGAQPRELPDQSEVDPTAISKEVLTKQGYVVPIAYHQPPVAANLR